VCAARSAQFPEIEMSHRSLSLGPILALGCLVAVQAAEVDSWRCGSVIIRRGETLAEVRDHCGEPTLQQTVSEPVFARNSNGGVREIGVTQIDHWTYERSGRIPVRLTFEEGKLTRIEYLEP
jgi:hypothetical protein